MRQSESAKEHALLSTGRTSILNCNTASKSQKKTLTHRNIAKIEIETDNLTLPFLLAQVCTFIHKAIKTYVAAASLTVDVSH